MLEMTRRIARDVGLLVIEHLDANGTNNDFAGQAWDRRIDC